MTAVTPGSAGLLALANDLMALFDRAIEQNKSRPELTEHELGVLHNSATALRLAAKPAEEVREATIEECARVCESRVKGTDGLRGGNDYGHHAPYNAEDLACASAIRALSHAGAPKP